MWASVSVSSGPTCTNWADVQQAVQPPHGTVLPAWPASASRIPDNQVEKSPAGVSSVPDDGFPWQPTRQPVVLDLWPVTPAPAGGRFTTVMQWDSYPAREYGGRRFGMKSESFGPPPGRSRYGAKDSDFMPYRRPPYSRAG